MARTSRGRLAPLWIGLHLALARALALAARRAGAAAIYARGSFGRGEPVAGFSDLDLVALAPSAGAAEALRQRRDELSERLPALARLVTLAVYDATELRSAAGATVLTYGLAAPLGEDPRLSALHLRPRRAPRDEVGLRLRPSLSGRLADWRRLAGADALVAPERHPLERLPVAWLELQTWWRHAFRLLAGEPRLDDPHIAAKVVAEPARVLVWLRTGSEPLTRLEALAELPSVAPEVAHCAALGRDLDHRAHRLGRPPMGDVLGGLLALSEAIAADAAGAGGEVTEVALDGLGEPPDGEGPVPLADWRARTNPGEPDETLAPREGDPADPGTMRAACREGREGALPLMAHGGLLVLPTAQPWRRGVLRCVQCAESDPVTAALAAGRSSARFPVLPGWSAADGAARAVAEHRSWLADVEPEHTVHGRGLGLLFTAARAALFQASIERGEPRLALTVAATADALERVEPGPAADALAEFRAARAESRAPRPEPVLALRALVEEALPALGPARTLAR